MKSSTLTFKLALALALTLTLLHPNAFTNAQTIKATSLETCTDNPTFTFGSYPSDDVQITRTCEWIVESGNTVQIQVRRSSWCDTVHTSSNSKIQDECPIACDVPKCRKTTDPTFDLNVCSTYEDLWSQDLKNSCSIPSSDGSTSCKCTDAMNKIEQGIINCNDINTKCPTGCNSCNLCLKVFSTCLVGNQSKITPLPTSSPSVKPTNSPSVKPTNSPSVKPTNSPTSSPTSSSSPTIEPTSNPTSSPTSNPTSRPTASPTASPTIDCTGMTISNDENNELLLYGNSDDADGIIKIGYQLDIELNDTNPILIIDDSPSSSTADTAEMNNMTSSETNSTSTSRTALDEKTDMVLNTTTLSFILKDITDQITSLIVSDLFTECSSDSSSASRKRRTTTSAATTLTTAISTETTKREVSIRRNREQLERRQSQETPLSSISFDNIGIIGLSATNGQILPEESCSNEQYESGTTCVVVGSEISLLYKFINNNDKLSTGDLEKEAEMKGQTFSAISAFVSQLNDDDGDGSGSGNGLYSVKSVKEVKEETNKEDKDETIPIDADKTDPEEDVTGLSGLYIFLIAGGASFCIMAFGFFAVRRRKQQRLSDRKHSNNSSFSELSKIDPMQDDSKEDDSNEDDDSKLEVKIVDVGYSIDNEHDVKIEKQKIFAIDEESMIIHNLVDQSTSSNQDLNLEDKKRFSVEGWSNRVNVARDYFKNQSGLLKSDTSTISSMGWKDDSNMMEMGADFSQDSFKHRMSIARNLIDSPARSTRSNRKNDDNGSPSTLGTQIASISSSSDRVKVARSFILGSSDGSVKSGENMSEIKEENRVKHVSASSNDITQTISPKTKKNGDDAAQEPLNNSEKNIDIIIKNKEWENQAEDASPSDDNDTQSASLEESREEEKLEHFSKSSGNYSPMLSLSSSERLKIARSALLHSGDLVLESRAQSKREAGQENKGHQ